VGNGERLSESMEQTGFFQPEIIQMLKVGENAGKIDEMLLNIVFFVALRNISKKENVLDGE
jgi:type II secretory pathway component PulF